MMIIIIVFPALVKIDDSDYDSDPLLTRSLIPV